MSQKYSESMDIPPAVPYIPWDKSENDKTVNTITFAQSEEGYLFSETRNDTESGNKSDENLTLVPFISEEDIDVMSLGNESDAEPISTDMLKDIHDGSQSHLRINSREARYKIRDFLKEGQAEWKGALL